MKRMLALASVLACALDGACLAPAGTKIVARDIAGAIPEFRSTPEDAFIAWAPLAGVRRVISAAELRHIATGLHVTLPVASELCFEWPMEPLTDVRLAAALRAAIPQPTSEIQILDWLRGPAPKGELSFPVAGYPAARNAPRSPVTWRGRIRYGGDHDFVVWVRAVIVVKQARAVALERLSAGRPILPGQVRLEEADAPPFSKPVTLADVVGSVPRFDVAPGAAVAVEQLSVAYDVERGDRVTLETRSERTRLKTEAIAEAAGHRGEVIPVHNLSSGKRLRARIEDRGLVGLVGPGPEAVRPP